MAPADRTARLFIVRLWREEADYGQLEWRGRVQALPDGEVYYFRNWPGLIGRLEAMQTPRRDPANEHLCDPGSSRTRNGQ